MAKNKIQSVRGMKDLFGQELFQWKTIENSLRETFKLYNCHEIRTPILENEALFQRSAGKSSDIIQKEMYRILEKQQSSQKDTLVMRAEGTAPVIRALIQHQLLEQLPQKFYYLAPMFRRERPQKGRYRQHHQFGFEFFGYSSAYSDFEGLCLCRDLFNSVGISDVSFTLNSLGDQEDRKLYKQKLLDFLTPFKKELSEDSQNRLEINPLRILDSKNEVDQEILAKGAPKIKDCLSKKSLERWNTLLELSKNSSLNISIDENLVRGLDYYTHTVFEVKHKNKALGSQDSIAGGGRYNNLVNELGGAPVAAFGMGAGIERLMLILEEKAIKSPESPKPVLYIAALEEKAIQVAAELSSELRKRGLIVEWNVDPVKNFKKLLKKANQAMAKHTLILGPEEVNKGQIKIKDMQKGEEEVFALNKSLDQSKVTEIADQIEKIL